MHVINLVEYHRTLIIMVIKAFQLKLYMAERCYYFELVCIASDLATDDSSMEKSKA